MLPLTKFYAVAKPRSPQRHRLDLSVAITRVSLPTRRSLCRRTTSPSMKGTTIRWRRWRRRRVSLFPLCRPTRKFTDEIRRPRAPLTPHHWPPAPACHRPVRPVPKMRRLWNAHSRDAVRAPAGFSDLRAGVMAPERNGRPRGPRALSIRGDAPNAPKSCQDGLGRSGCG